MDQFSSTPTERSLYIGNALGCIIYGAFDCRVRISKFEEMAAIGIQLCITLKTVYLLTSNPTHDKAGKRRRWFFIGYSVILLILMTFAFSTNVLAGQLMWIEHRDSPGGPFEYFLSQGSRWIGVLGSSTDIVGNFMGDALLVGERPDTIIVLTLLSDLPVLHYLELHLGGSSTDFNIPRLHKWVNWYFASQR